MTQLLEIESETAIMKLSRYKNNNKVVIDLMDIIGEVNTIMIDHEQAKQIINFLKNVYEQPSTTV